MAQRAKGRFQPEVGRKVIQTMRRIWHPSNYRWQAKVIEGSEWFDGAWYERTNFGEGKLSTSASWHYLLYGADLDLNPGPKFDTKYYKLANPDVAKAGVNPLVHFELHGKAEGRQPTDDDDVSETPQDGRGGAVTTEFGVDAKTEPHWELRLPLNDRWRYTDLAGADIALHPRPAFGSRGYELRPEITGPCVVVPVRRSMGDPVEPSPNALGIHIHLHYVELFEEFIEALKSVPYSFSLYVSLTEAVGWAKQSLRDRLAREVPAASTEIRIVENRGRDVAPLVTEFADSLLSHEIVGHLHGKMSPHNSDKADWRDQLMFGLLASSIYVDNILQIFRDNPQIGLVFPEYHWSLAWQISWGTCLPEAQRLSERLRVKVEEGRLALFPAGSFFWARKTAIRPLFEGGLRREDFPEEEGQVDGTPAHALERIVGEVAFQAGYNVLQVKPDRQYSLRKYFTKEWPYVRPLTRSYQEIVAEWRRERREGLARIAVFTAITGGYEEPVVHEVLSPEVDYYLFSDRMLPDRGFWAVRQIDYHHPDPVRRARYVKTHAHRLLRGYDVAIWVDANVVIQCDVAKLASEVERDGGAGILGIAHPQRRTPWDEAAAVKNAGKDCPNVIDAQMQRYRDEGFVGDGGLIETNCMAFNLREEGVRRFLMSWWGEISVGSRRDQLSCMYALWKTGQPWQRLLKGGRSLRNAPGFAYLGHGINTGADYSVEGVPGELIEPRAHGVPGPAGKGTAEVCVSVVVCVHDALELAAVALSCVEKSMRRGDELIIVDDASSYWTQHWLEAFAAERPYVYLIRHEGRPRGYCRSANHGIAASGGEAILLLNSDTQVTESTLGKLVNVWSESCGVGIVGPVSNAASYQSIPNVRSTSGQTAINQLPGGVSVECMDRWCARVSPRTGVASVPLVHGFCQLIGREVLNAVGAFDEEAFPEGYGEENDLCFRASARGFDLLVATNTFVYHKKSASYRDEERRTRLMRAGSVKLKGKHGEQRISDAVRALEEHPVLTKLRRMCQSEFYGEVVTDGL